MTRARTYSLITIVFSFGLLLLGVMVHYSSNSLVCTSWPLCYGAGESLEFGLNKGHRFLGLIVGVLTLLLAFVLKKNEKDDESHGLSLLGFFALFLVGVQGLLGGITSFYRLPTIVNTSHFALSLFFVTTLILIDHRLALRHSIKDWKVKPKLWGGLQLSDGLGLLVFLSASTIILGAFVRHAGVLNACGLGWDSVLSCREGQGTSLWPDGAPGQIHMFYRFVSFFTWAFGAMWLFHLNKQKPSSALKKVAAMAMITLSCQQILGLLAVAWKLSQPWTILHFAFGVLSLALLWKLNLQVRAVEKNILQDSRFSFWSDMLELTKPRLGMLVMSTVFVGMMLAPRPLDFFVGLKGFFFTFILVMGAAAFNCWLERDIDKLMDRTKDRPLPTGRMNPNTALFASSFLMVVAILGLYWSVNGLTAWLGFIAAALYVFAYTPLKQKSVLALYVGAIPGALPPLMGWTIVMGKMTDMGWALFWILFVWQLPHFLAISIYHAKDYGKADIKVYPNSFGLTLTKWGIFSLTALLAYVALYPWIEDIGVTDMYGYFSLFLNTIFLGVSIKVLLVSNEKEELLRKWARIYFFGSIFYLPLLLGSMIYLS